MILLVLLAACASTEPPAVVADDDDVVPLGGGYDDDDDAADDDDATGDDDDFTYDPPTTFDLDPCWPDQVLTERSGCTELPLEVFTVEQVSADCPLGDRTVPGAVAWAALLETCGVDVDPVPSVDWGVSELRVMIGAGEGCACVNGGLWLQRCADGDHLGHYFYTCGPCGDPWSRMTIVPVEQDSDPTVEHCLPYDLRCEV